MLESIFRNYRNFLIKLPGLFYLYIKKKLFNLIFISIVFIHSIVDFNLS